MLIFLSWSVPERQTLTNQNHNFLKKCQLLNMPASQTRILQLAFKGIHSAIDISHFFVNSLKKSKRKSWGNCHSHDSTHYPLALSGTISAKQNECWCHLLTLLGVDIFRLIVSPIDWTPVGRPQNTTSCSEKGHHLKQTKNTLMKWVQGYIFKT